MLTPNSSRLTKFPSRDFLTKFFTCKRDVFYALGLSLRATLIVSGSSEFSFLPRLLGLGGGPKLPYLFYTKLFSFELVPLPLIIFAGVNIFQSAAEYRTEIGFLRNVARFFFIFLSFEKFCVTDWKLFKFEKYFGYFYYYFAQLLLTTPFNFLLDYWKRKYFATLMFCFLLGY